MSKPAAKAAVAPKKTAAPARAKASGTKAATGGRKAARVASPAASKGGAKRTKAAGQGRGSGSKSSSADRFLDEQRALLQGEREASLRQAESLRAEAEQLAEEMEPGDTQFDEESGEGGTLNVERERDLALSAQARAAVEEIDRALAKIDAGTYGTCEQCGQSIPKARLKALPYATLCVACKSGGLSRR
jgi:RNA polymerase-binding transcription factor